MRTPPPTPRSAPFARLAALAALPALLLALAACDTTDPGPDPIGPDPIDPITGDQAALVAEAFADVESLFALGISGDAQARSVASLGGDGGPVPDPATDGDPPLHWRTWLDQFAATGGDRGPAPDDPALRVAVDTTLYTGVFDAANGLGYLVQLTYRMPQGVGIWGARVQHARSVDHDADGGTPEIDAVETVQLTFLTYADLDAFMMGLDGGTLDYFTDASDDAEAELGGYDTWRVTQVYSPAEGQAVVTYANVELRESITVRDPVVTLNADGTGNVRDGGPDGAVRTRYYGADFAVNADGSFTGTHLRTLLSSGDTADGSITSLSTDETDGSWRQTRQRGGDGVVVRENSEG